MKQNGLPETLKRAVAELRGLEHVPAVQVDLFERISRAQWRATQSLGDERIYPDLSSSTAAQMASGGFYLLDFTKLTMRPDDLLGLFAEICQVLSDVGDLDPKRAARLVSQAEEGALSLTDLGRAAFAGDQGALSSLAKRLKVGKRVLSWLAVLILRPYLGKAASELAKHLQATPGGDDWPHPYCPVCGHDPFMAITIRPNGRKFVECSMCGTRWEVRRGRCVFCGNEDKESYKFLYYDLEAPYRVDVCGKCGRYIKGVDERKMPGDREPVLMACDIATLYFDELARRKRYQPPGSTGRVGKLSSNPMTKEVVTQ